MSEADTFKDKGNKAFAAKDYDTANEWFSKAIEADPSNHVLFSNRSACYAAKKNWGVALEDAEQVRWAARRDFLGLIWVQRRVVHKAQPELG